jgi:hypothetical protein
MGAIFTWLASLLTGPLLKGALDAYKQKLAAGNTSEKIAADIAVRELTVQQAEIEAQKQLKIAEIGHWYEPTHLFAYIMVVYFGKIVIYDKVLGSITGGSTDPITGSGGEWAGLIMTFYLGKRGIENVARILKR